MKIKILYTIITALSLLVFLMAFVPFLPKGIPSGHDVMSDLIYLTKFKDAISDGQFPVRFNDWFVPGFNQPLSNFYQPGFYYISLIPSLIGIPNTEALKITLVALWLVSGLLMYLFTKRHFGTLGGILGAAFYMFAPYHIGDLVVRAAYTEFAALAFAPGIFWAVKGFYDTKKGWYLSLMSVFIALTVLSHPPVILMFSPLILAYIMYLVYQVHSSKFKTFNFKLQFLTFNFGLLISFLFGLSLIAFFILPSFFEQQYVQIIYMRSGYYDFANHFVCLPQLFIPNWGYNLSTTGCSDDMSFQIGLPHLLAAGMVVYFFVNRFFQKENPAQKHVISNPEGMRNPLRIAKASGDFSQASPDRNDRLFLLFLSFLAFYVFMTLEISEPFWENLPLVPFIQYPWRFLASIMFVTSFLAASVPGFFESSKVPSQSTSKVAKKVAEGLKSNLTMKQFNNRTISKYIVFAILILLLPIFYSWYLRPSVYFTKEQEDFDSADFLAGVKPETGNLLPEIGYQSIWTQVLPSIDELPESEAIVLTEEKPKRDPSDLVFGQQSPVEAVKLTAHKKQYKVNAEGKMLVRFYTHYFPGWKVRVDQKPLPLCHPGGIRQLTETDRISSGDSIVPTKSGLQNDNCFSYDNIYGYMDVPIPKGKHSVVLSFENTPIRTAGNWLTLLSIPALIGLALVPNITKRKR